MSHYTGRLPKMRISTRVSDLDGRWFVHDDRLPRGCMELVDAKTKKEAQVEARKAMKGWKHIDQELRASVAAHKKASRRRG